MNASYKLLVILLMIIITQAFSSPKLLSSLNDAPRLNDNAYLFVNKPLKILLKEIGPKIKMVSVDGKPAHRGVPIIIFRFTDGEGLKAYNLAGKRPVAIVVRIKERFEWNKPRSEMLTWTKADAEKYGTLTILAVGVVGESL